MNPTENAEWRIQVLQRLHWNDTLLTRAQKKVAEDFLLEYHDLFARHSMDNGINTEFSVKRTQKDDKVDYSQNLPMPIHLKEDSIVKLPLMHKYDIITLLMFPKNACPVFAKRKANWKLRQFLVLRKLNTLVADDYTNNNQPVNSLSAAAHSSVGNPLFFKLDWSQALFADGGSTVGGYASIHCF